MKTDVQEWPPRPPVWPDVLSEVEVCQYLRLDDGRSVEVAKRSLRYIRRTQGLRSAGRVGAGVLFRLATLEAWVADREASQVPTKSGFTTAENEY